MLHYKNIKKEDIEKIVNHGLQDTKFWNEFVDQHLFTTCAKCGKEYQIKESPVLHDELWGIVLEKLNLQKQQELSYQAIDEEKRQFQNNRRNRLIKWLSCGRIDCNVCSDCMEIALGRKLKITDLKMCEINIKLIKQGKYV